MLPPETQARILSLHFGEKQSARHIAKELGVNRKTVSSVIERRTVHTGAVLSSRKSILDPYKAVIEEKLTRDATIPATTLYHTIRKLGFTGGVRLVRFYVAAARTEPRPKEAFLKLQFEAGETAQVDWGEFGDVFGTGRKIHAFVMVLCYSRKLYVEFTRAEKFEDFIRCHENAFRFFGGAPKECWYDNLATAVTDRVGRLVRFNSRFHAYLSHHGTTPYACTPARGNEKGRVEDGVKYLRSSFWAGREFQNFDDLVTQCRTWLTEVANLREHRSHRRIPDLVFESEEKSLLLQLNPHTFETDEIISKEVPPQFHLTYDTNQYSVPWTLVGMVVTMRISDLEILFFYGGKFIARHVRCYGKHQEFALSEHREGILERKPGSDHHVWQVACVKKAGPSLERYLKMIQSGQRSLRHEVQRLLALITVYGAAQVNLAAEELLTRGIVGTSSLELLLKAQGSEAISPEPLTFQNTKLNRMSPPCDLTRYDSLLLADEVPENSTTTETGESANETIPHPIDGRDAQGNPS